MQLGDFRQMIDRMVEEIPREYLEGITGIDVSPRTVPHPERTGVYTMGECIPVNVGGEDAPSRVVLYHGSFQALARERADFDWRSEAWDTVTHELRHHLEWRARTQDLEEYDWAAEQGFARADDERYDPVFFLAGERIAPDVYQVDDDVFMDRVVKRLPAVAEMEWTGRRYRVTVPADPLPLYLLISGVSDPPPGDLILVFRRAPAMLDLFRKKHPPTEREARAEPVT
jgi:hypothetical protein